jgi:hypothetical protein
MRASAVSYTLTYFNTPKRQLVIWTVVGPAAAKFKSHSDSESESKSDLLTVRLGDKPLENHDQ